MESIKQSKASKSGVDRYFRADHKISPISHLPNLTAAKNATNEVILPAISLKNRSSLQEQIAMEHIPAKSALAMEKKTNRGGGGGGSLTALSIENDRGVI